MHMCVPSTSQSASTQNVSSCPKKKDWSKVKMFTVLYNGKNSILSRTEFNLLLVQPTNTSQVSREAPWKTYPLKRTQPLPKRNGILLLFICF